MIKEATVSTATSLLLGLLLSCSQDPKETSSTTPLSASNKAAEASATTQEVKVYDISKEDITKVPGITSRNISVQGVKLGDRTRDVDKLLGNPIKTEKLPKIYRSAYLNHGIYLDFDRYTGKVTTIYINTNYYKKAKGNLSDLLAHGKLDVLQKAFGDDPLESKPEPNSTMWEYPKKGIQFIHLKQEGLASYTLKLVEPRKG
jgi:hypothetical protein